MNQYLSPFSLSYEWRVKWQQNNRVNENAMNWNGKNEDSMLSALAIVGVIGSLQLTRLFLDGDKRKIKKLELTGKLTRHSLFKGKQEIPIFTLGPTAIEMIKEKFPIVDWRKFKIPDLLQRVIFFQLVSKFKEENDHVRILPSNFPFVGSVVRKDKKFHVLIERGNENELIHTFKFSTPSERFIYIKETLEHGKSVNEYLQKCKMRLTTDHDMTNKPFQEMFYLWENGHWVPERQLINEIKELKEVKEVKEINNDQQVQSKTWVIQKQEECGSQPEEETQQQPEQEFVSQQNRIFLITN